eukprot:7377026-Prymnesium_polylepis.1
MYLVRRNVLQGGTHDQLDPDRRVRVQGVPHGRCSVRRGDRAEDTRAPPWTLAPFGKVGRGGQMHRALCDWRQRGPRAAGQLVVVLGRRGCRYRRRGLLRRRLYGPEVRAVHERVEILHAGSLHELPRDGRSDQHVGGHHRGCDPCSGMHDRYCLSPGAQGGPRRQQGAEPAADQADEHSPGAQAEARNRLLPDGWLHAQGVRPQAAELLLSVAR